MMISVGSTKQKFKVYYEGKPYEVWLVEDVNKTARDLHFEGVEKAQPGQEECGMLDYEQSVILIEDGMSQAERDSTLLHELIHASLPRLSEASVLKLEDFLFPILRKHGLRFTKPSGRQTTRTSQGEKDDKGS